MTVKTRKKLIEVALPLEAINVASAREKSIRHGQARRTPRQTMSRSAASAAVRRSAPTAAAAHRGLEDRRVKLGCVMPGEAPAVFGDALRRLAASATYPYQDGPRAWFHGSVRVDPARVGRDASRIAEEVVAHLAGQVGAELTVTIEIQAWLPNGASDQLVRTVLENRRTLKFDGHGFERE